MATSSRPCSVESCRTPSRSLCICCEKSYCFEHLGQHFNRINNQVPPLADKISGLEKRFFKFLSIEPSYLVALEKWRTEAHETIEKYYENKRRDYVDDRSEKLRKEIERVRNMMEKLIRKNDALREDIDLLTQDVRLIEQKLVEFQTLRFIIHPLVIDENLIIRDILPLSNHCRTMQIPFNEFPAMATNDKYMLVHQPPNLCLYDRHFSIVKQVQWANDDIFDMNWGPPLDRFILVTMKDVFTLEQNTMNIAKYPLQSSASWYRGTCSDNTLFLSTQGLAPSIYEFKFPASSKSLKERQSPDTCGQSEYIFDLKANGKTLAMVIFNTENNKTHLDLCSTASLERLWSIDVGCGFRCCLFHGEQWMVVDPADRRLFHIGNDGTLIKNEKYPQRPWNIVQWGKYIVGIRTDENIHLH